MHLAVPPTARTSPNSRQVESAPEANGKVSYDHSLVFHIMNFVFPNILDAGAGNLQATRRDPLSKLF